jgi:hypothetical protein
MASWWARGMLLEHCHALWHFKTCLVPDGLSLKCPVSFVSSHPKKTNFKNLLELVSRNLQLNSYLFALDPRAVWLFASHCELESASCDFWVHSMASSLNSLDDILLSQYMLSQPLWPMIDFCMSWTNKKLIHVSMFLTTITVAKFCPKSLHWTCRGKAITLEFSEQHVKVY